MTPSHHGLGSVVLCTVGAPHRRRGHAPRRRHGPGRPRIATTSSTWPPASGWRPTEFERVLHLQTPAGRVSLGVEKVSQPFDTTERIPLSALAGAETARHFEAMAQVNGQWYLVLDVRPFTGGSAHAAEADAGRKRRAGRRGDAGEPRPDAPGPPRRARPSGRVLGRDVAVRGASAGLRAQRGAGRRGHVRPGDRADAAGAAARARPLRLARPPAARRRPAGPADDGSAAAPPIRERLIVCRRGSSRDLFGVLAASDIQMVRLPIAHAPTVRDFPLDRRCTRTVVDVGETTLVLPDLARLSDVTAATPVDDGPVIVNHG